MTLKKAVKHLASARQHLDFYKELYVQNERDTNTILDVKMCFGGKTIREERREEYIKEMHDAKERIAKFERIIL